MTSIQCQQLNMYKKKLHVTLIPTLIPVVTSIMCEIKLLIHSQNSTVQPFTSPLHWGWEKMAAIFQTTYSKAYLYGMELYEDFIKVPNGPINNTPALLQIMAWHRPGDKPLSQPMMFSLPAMIYWRIYTSTEIPYTVWVWCLKIVTNIMCTFCILFISVYSVYLCKYV